MHFTYYFWYVGYTNYWEAVLHFLIVGHYWEEIHAARESESPWLE